MAGAFDPNAFQNDQFQTPGVPPPPVVPPPLVPGSSFAISGATRSGAFRSDAWPIQNWLLVKVGDSIMTNPIEHETIEIIDNQNQTQDTCSFLCYGNPYGEPPQAGQEIVIANGTFANRLFGGAIDQLTQLPMKPGQPEQWIVSCVDWWYYANMKRVYAKYLTEDADVIFKDIVSRFTTGFTFNNVMPGPSITGGIEFNGETVMAALAQLSNRIGWDNYIDWHKDFHFFDIEVVKARALTPRRYHYWDLTFKEDLSQVRNRVFQAGGGGTTTAQVAPGALSIPLDVVSWYPTSGPHMRVKVGGQIIPYTAVAGLALTIPAGAITHTIPEGTEVPIWIQVDDLVSQAEMSRRMGPNHDGIIEYEASPDGRLSVDGCVTKATAELIQYAAVPLSGNYKCRDREARSGRLVEIRLPYRGQPLRNKRFMITSVTTRVLGAKRNFEKTVTFGSTEKLDFYTAIRGVI